jgi:hypothetical protein
MGLAPGRPQSWETHRVKQLEFSWRNEDTLRRELELQTGLKLCLTLTDNTSTMLSIRRDRARGRTRVRAHRMFLSAEPRVIRAMAEWLTRPRAQQSGVIIDRFIEANRHRIRAERPRPGRFRTQGQFFDLQRYFDYLNDACFENSVTAAITWGRMPAATSRRRRSIRFGSYTQEDHLIRIHPLLDQGFVPDYVVQYIVFHEMLHAYLGVGVAPNGRRRIHTAEFRQAEQAYPDYQNAVSWLEHPRNLVRLLSPQRAA